MRSNRCLEIPGLSILETAHWSLSDKRHWRKDARNALTLLIKCRLTDRPHDCAIGWLGWQIVRCGARLGNRLGPMAVRCVLLLYVIHNFVEWYKLLQILLERILILATLLSWGVGIHVQVGLGSILSLQIMVELMTLDRWLSSLWFILKVAAALASLPGSCTDTHRVWTFTNAAPIAILILLRVLVFLWNFLAQNSPWYLSFILVSYVVTLLPLVNGLRTDTF